MRVAAVLIVFAACSDPGGSDPSSYPYEPGSSPDPGNDGGCQSDSDCSSGLVCARDFSCDQASDLYTAHISWTIKGDAASAATCANLPDLNLNFSTTDDYWFGFAPIACDQGKFTIDKLPTWYVEATIDTDTDNGVSTAIDPKTGIATLDLPY